MIRPKTYWIVAIEDVETAEICYIMDKYKHRPQRYIQYSDAVRAASKYNHIKANDGIRRAYIVEQCDGPKKTELVRG